MSPASVRRCDSSARQPAATCCDRVSCSRWLGSPLPNLPHTAETHQRDSRCWRRASLADLLKQRRAVDKVWVAPERHAARRSRRGLRTSYRHCGQPSVGRSGGGYLPAEAWKWLSICRDVLISRPAWLMSRAALPVPCCTTPAVTALLWYVLVSLRWSLQSAIACQRARLPFAGM